LLSALALWFVLYALFLSGLQESHAQHLLYGQLRNELAQATVPIGGAIKEGTPVAYINAAAIGLQAVVVEGTSSGDLTKGPGHLPTSPLPGQAGNSVIFGRSAMFGAPFGRVHDLRPGAIIMVTTGQSVFDFRVLDLRGPGAPLPTSAAIGQSSLTLGTSAGAGWRNGWAPNEVIYADATLVAGKMQPAPPGRPTAAPITDNPMAGNTSELYPLVLWLAGLALLGVGLAYAYTRWTVWQLWVVGLPSVAAVLWIVTSLTLQLLPNLT
jgi:sortase A